MTKALNLGRSIRLVRRICQIAGAPDLIDDSRVSLAQHGVIAAVRRRDTTVIFNWLVNGFSYQGVSDSIASGYMERHGRVRWHDIAKVLADQPSCPKLTCYWAFERCGYRKGSGLCANLEDQPGCPLPRHDLRNGRLNQTAYSLFLFMRDLAGGDIVGWIDQRLEAVDLARAPNRPASLRQALLKPLGHIYGVSNKVLAMALSDLLLAGDAKRSIWIEAGGAMIAIDTLVHNFLHRTGILCELGADHAYGPGCYRPGGCADIIERIAGKIDARRFNPPSRLISPALCSSRFGASALKPGSTAATAIASTTARHASRPTVRSSGAALACRSNRCKRANLHVKRERLATRAIMCCKCASFLICSWCRDVRSPVAVLTNRTRREIVP